ncbi:MAG: hypothetical protein PHZ03_08155 [Syntrophomonas sp.]|nr:hypothetical protein [Syntrophomonas sp.]
MATTYYRTTGPISSSLGLDHIMVDVLNNTSDTRSVRIKVYDLSVGAPIIMFTKKVNIKPFSNVTQEIAAAESSIWEVQIVTNSKRVRSWVGGQDDAGMNLIGNVVLSSQLQAL